MHLDTDPLIHKSAQVLSKLLIFRDATLEDANLILDLRMDEMKGRFLSATSESLESKQVCVRA